MVIEAGLIPVLVDILATSQYKTKRESAWAITNALSGGNPQQIQYDC